MHTCYSSAVVGHRGREQSSQSTQPSGPAALALAFGRGRGSPLVAVVGEGGHELRLAGQGLLFEVGALQAVPGCRPFLRVVHEEEVEQTQAGLRQPREPVLQVVVRLSPQAVLADQRQLGETHMSMLVVCVVVPSSSSGARYHSVTTLGVIGFTGMP